MKRNLEHLVDRGCWISDDRVYAFIATPGIAEAGYHGTQPVSRNSRLLVRREGVLLPVFRMSDGSERGVVFKDVVWDPGGVATEGDDAGGVEIRTSGRKITVAFTRRDGGVRSAIVRVPRRITFSGVHGTRTWKAARQEDDGLFLECRDLIMLHSWLERTGPYAGDFLLPEPLRKKIFTGDKRSGRATRADLRPEYGDNDFAVYDAVVTIAFGGDGFRMTREHDAWVFEASFDGRGNPVLAFDVVFGDGGVALGEEAASSFPLTKNTPFFPPVLTLEGFPRWAEFLASIPALVDSCRVRDYGVPRACPGSYYWIWAWDMLVTAAEATRWGDVRLARDVAAFVNAHRDVGEGTMGVIPARWTRSLLPLDTPSPGGIEFLFAALALDGFLESGDRDALKAAYVNLRRLYDAVEAEIHDTGAVTGEGFYPDLLDAFGRTRESAVAMEVGSWYCLARLTGAIARELGDEAGARRMEEGAVAIGRGFDGRFWDDEAGFFIDAPGALPGASRRYHPLFSLLFLHSSLGFVLIRRRVARAAAFVDQQLLSEHGMRTLPLGEGSAGGETVLDAWYPHWDVYGLKLLRRAGRADGIMRWLRLCEETLDRLGYAPEFLSLRPFRQGRADAWTHHGAASNLNCVTGWSRAIREAVFGIDIDPGGITHIPLMLPVGDVSLRNLCWRGGIWSIDIDNSGPFLQEILVDDQALAGATKIPVEHATPGEHTLRIRYGQAVPGPYFEELVNAELLSATATNGVIIARIRGAGALDGTFFSSRRPAIAFDRVPVDAQWDERTGRGYFGAHLAGEHTLTLG